jgi:hypothetical protein
MVIPCRVPGFFLPHHVDTGMGLIKAMRHTAVAGAEGLGWTCKPWKAKRLGSMWAGCVVRGAVRVVDRLSTSG